MKNHVSVEEFVAMFEEIGLDETKRRQWHRIFEARHPAAHQGFLEWLEIDRQEIDRLRAMFR